MFVVVAKYGRVVVRSAVYLNQTVYVWLMNAILKKNHIKDIVKPLRVMINKNMLYHLKMVYDKIHDPRHACTHRLDEIYKRVEKALEALTKYYEKQEFISVAKYFKTFIYDNVDDDYQDYLEVYQSKGSSDNSSYITTSLDSLKTSN